jgi:hypothetical protein
MIIKSPSVNPVSALLALTACTKDAMEPLMRHYRSTEKLGNLEVKNPGTTVSVRSELRSCSQAPAEKERRVYVCVHRNDSESRLTGVDWEFPVSKRIAEELNGSVLALEAEVEVRPKAFHTSQDEISIEVAEWLEVGWLEVEEMSAGFLIFRDDDRCLRVEVTGFGEMHAFAALVNTAMKV